MSKQKKPVYLLISIFSRLPYKYKIKVFFLLFLMLLGGVIEFTTIGLLFPFLNHISSNLYEIQDGIARLPFGNFLNLKDFQMQDLGVFLLLVVSFASFLKLYIIRKSGLISASIGNKLGNDAFNGILLNDYQNFLLLDTSKLFSTISIQVTKVEGTLKVVLQSICSLIILIFIFASLIYIYPYLTIAITFVLSIIYFLISSFTRSRLRRSSYIITNEQKKAMKLLKESITGFKEIKINNTENFFLKNYQVSDAAFRNTNAYSSFLDIFPKYTIEAIIILSIISIASFVPVSYDNELIAALGIFAFAAQRLLPSLQQIYSGWARLNNTQSDLENIFNILFSEKIIDNRNKYIPLENNIKKSKQFNFSKIELKKISFHYPNSAENVITNVDLCINSGDIIGFKGPSGSGKTTLVDIIVGLLEPSKGDVLVDGESIIGDKNYLKRIQWLKNISYVPQNIFISDQPVYKNVAFGIPDHLIDIGRVKKSLEMAQLSNFTNESFGIFRDKFIGDSGNRISGGQRQRIGIARALYMRSKILVLDESTSALDSDTEKDIIELIKQLSDKLTIVMIAHRVSTLKICNKIFDLKNGKIKEINR